MNCSRRIALWLSVVCTLFAACNGEGSQAAAPGELRVFAAASLQESVSEAGDAFRAARPDVDVEFNFAGSNVLTRQIVSARDADVFVSANEDEIDHLENLGLVEDGTRNSLMSNRLVLIRSKREGAGKMFELQDLRELEGKIAIAGESVPAGGYGRFWLDALGVIDALEDQFVTAVDVRAAMGMVESGAVEYGIVYRTDARISDAVEVVFEQSAGSLPRVSYAVCALKGGESLGVAHDFIAFLLKSRSTFEQHGFVVDGQ